MQLPLDLIVPKSNWTAPSLSDLPADWNAFPRVAIDVETRDDRLRDLGVGVRRGGFIVGIVLAFEDGPCVYLPIKHATGTNLDAQQVMRYVRDCALTYRGSIVGANLPYDLDYLEQAGVTFPNVKWFRDVAVAEPLLDELQDSYSLENIGMRRLGIGKDEGMLTEALQAFAPKGTPKTKLKQFLWALPPELVGPYGEQDGRLPLQLIRAQEREIEAQELRQVYDLESKVLPVLLKMRRRGVRVDVAKLDEIDRWAATQEAEALARVRHATGVKIDVGHTMRAELIAPALKFIGVEPGRTRTGKVSVDKNLLASIKHPVATDLSRARKMSQLRTTFVASVREHMTNGRIHCTFNQLRKTDDSAGDDEGQGARYGRLSCADPNLQQQPARDPEIGPMWRSIYIPEEGREWGALDYSQQEPRWLVHWAVRSGTVLDNRQYGGPGTSAAALAAAERYRNDPTTDNHQMMADMAGIKRKDAKELFLGKIYGMGGPKLCGKLGLPTALYVRAGGGVIYPLETPAGRAASKAGGRIFEGAGEEGQKLIATFDERVPFARAMARLAESQAKRKGFIRTQSGRKCRFPKDQDGNWDWTHKALNRLIQGSSADQTKEAIVALDEAGHYIQLQVHDEVDGSFKDREEARAAAHIMETIIPMELPSKVDVEVGRSWGEAG